MFDSDESFWSGQSYIEGKEAGLAERREEVYELKERLKQANKGLEKRLAKIKQLKTRIGLLETTIIIMGRENAKVQQKNDQSANGA
jgi:hypothetical protein